MKKRFFLTALILQKIFFLSAQSNGQLDKNLVYKGQQLQAKVATSFLQAFKNGEFNAHLRYFFMSTQNEKNLTDYYANAIGAGIRFETAKFHNFQFAISDFTIFNIGSSNFTKPDSVTGQFSRYEIGNFDINNPDKKYNLNKLEELYIKFNYKHSFIKAGRQYINATFINLQDGRMSPTIVAGVWTEINEIKKLKLQLGWLWGISPRSTIGWYKPGQSIGNYPVGVNTNGTKSGYTNNIQSNGVGIIQALTNLSKKVKLQASEMFVTNVFNTTLLQIDYNYLMKNKSSLFASAQTIKQFAINDGGNINPLKTYFQKGGSAFSFGAKVGWKNMRWETTFNYNRITSQGRYLIPREWGIEPFFTFLPRERNDGFGNTNTYMGKVVFAMPKARLKTALAAGYYQLPDVKDYTLNKYGMPSYTQINADIKYNFKSTLKGLDVEFLLVSKFNNGQTYNNYKFIFNKVNMVQYNFILNYQL